MGLNRCSDAYSDTMLGYANSIRTVDGGTHIDGIKASLTRTLNNLGKKSKLIKVLFSLPLFIIGINHSIHSLIPSMASGKRYQFKW